MSSSNKFKHITLDERRIILAGITNGSSKSAIAETIGKDKSTVGKEIKLHRILSHKCAMPLECSDYRKCKYERNCSMSCPDYVPFHCSRRDRSPGACNGCSKYASCRFDKFYYKAEEAEHEYRQTLTDSRQGVNLTFSEAKTMSEIIAPLLKQGRSPYQILNDHPELGICEKTLYNYIEGGVFHEIDGIASIDLRRQVSRRMPKKKAAAYRKREDRRYLNGRTYKDYNAFLDENPGVFVTEMDTVYNDGTYGPFIKTFKFVQASLLIAFYHEEKTAAAMKTGVDLLESILGHELFCRYVNVLLTDYAEEKTMPKFSFVA